jgi:hypothetical protein
MRDGKSVLVATIRPTTRSRAAIFIGGQLAGQGALLPKGRVTHNGRTSLIAEWKAELSDVRHNQKPGGEVYRLR